MTGLTTSLARKSKLKLFMAINSNNETIRRFSHLLEKRYDYAIRELISEEIFLIKLKEKVEIIKKERIGKLSGYYFDNFSKTLEKCIQKVERNKKITE